MLFDARSESFVLCRRRCASNVVQRTGPASDWRQRTLVVSAQEIPFATETWRGVVCWRGGWFRGWRGGGWWCCGGGVEREVDVVVGSDGVQGGGGCGVGSGQGNLRERCCCCGGVSWRERKAHFGWGQVISVISSSTSTTLRLAKGALREASSFSSRKRTRNPYPAASTPSKQSCDVTEYCL